MSNPGALPAFPAVWKEWARAGDCRYEVDKDSPGMSKREAFAMAAMQGMLANPGWDPNVENALKITTGGAVVIADALLAELAK